MATDVNSMWASICLLATRPADPRWETIKCAVGIVVAAAVALVVAFVTHSLANRRERQRAALDALKARRDLTIGLWQIWTSDSFFAMRQGLMDVITGDSHGSPPPEISYRRIRALGQKKALHSIQHFFVDLCEIKERGLVDLVLFDALFHEVIRRWKPALLAVQLPVSGGRNIAEDVRKAFAVLDPDATASRVNIETRASGFRFACEVMRDKPSVVRSNRSRGA